MDSVADRRAMLLALDGKFHETAVGPLLGIFDAEYLESVDTETRSPMIECTTDDVTRLEIKKGTSIETGGKTYKVRRHEPDGTGMSRLILE